MEMFLGMAVSGAWYIGHNTIVCCSLLFLLPGSVALLQEKKVKVVLEVMKCDTAFLQCATHGIR